MTLSSQTIEIGDITISVTRKRIKRLNLRVHSPDGQVTVSAPRSVSLSTIKSFATEQVEWIRRQRDRIVTTEPGPATQFMDGEGHSIWGRPHRLIVVERDGRQGVSIDDDCLTLHVRPRSDARARARVMHAWHKSILAQALPPLIRKWEGRLNVRLHGYALRTMKTRWGSCNTRRKHIRLNTELATKPIHLVEYVVVHELVHLRVPNHGPRFVALMDQHVPSWRQARKELNHAASPQPVAP
jgi:predicted metal-dependent hydrolase